MKVQIYRFVVNEYMIGDKKHVEYVECESCRYHAPLRTFHTHTEQTKLETVKRHLCELCAGSMCSSMTGYPSQHPEFEQAILTVYCTNALLEKLGKFHGAPVYTTTEKLENMQIP